MQRVSLALVRFEQAARDQVLHEQVAREKLRLELGRARLEALEHALEALRRAPGREREGQRLREQPRVDAEPARGLERIRYLDHERTAKRNGAPKWRSDQRIVAQPSETSAPAARRAGTRH